MFKANVGDVDSKIRLFVGIICMALAFLVTGFVQYIAMAVGFVMVITSVIRFCPAYMLMGKSTCKTDTH